MTNNITTLALNLLISERQGHRDIFGEKIKEHLCRSEDETQVQRILKMQFLASIDKCVADPNCESREVFYMLAQFYNEYFNNARKAELSIAA